MPLPSGPRLGLDEIETTADPWPRPSHNRGHDASLIDADSGASRDLVVSSKSPLNRPHFSPDNRYLALRAHFSEDQHVQIVRLQGSDPIVGVKWMAVGSAERDLRPFGWSPDGRVLHPQCPDGYRCLYAQRIDQHTGLGSVRPS